MSVQLSDNRNGTIAPGTVVGGRIVVERTVREDATGTLLFARDAKTRKSIALYVMSPFFAVKSLAPKRTAVLSW